jgi:hypothetical protein
MCVCSLFYLFFISLNGMKKPSLNKHLCQQLYLCTGKVFVSFFISESNTLLHQQQSKATQGVIFAFSQRCAALKCRGIAADGLPSWNRWLK